MSGVTVFKTLAEAEREGFSVYDKTNTGYLVRKKTAGGWAMALMTRRI